MQRKCKGAQQATRSLALRKQSLFAFSSKGTTLVPGDLIFTGTPEGLGMGRNPPFFWLQGGDIVEVSLKGVATCANGVEYGKEMAEP
jgi:2-keto-4-pentenoate hydratase/2-oxohepta-3-ene-1,7-dioic acid hydratase in catechol pathway